MSGSFDAVVVGAGPNGLAAAVELARNGRSVLVREGNPTVGGGARTEALTLPGFRHDVGSAVYPLGAGSPFFQSLPLAEHGLEWVHPELPLAHPLDGGGAVALHRSFDDTAAELAADAPAYRRMVEPFVRRWPDFVDHVLAALTRPPTAPALMARFALTAFRSAASVGRRFRTAEARALLAGNSAHSTLPLELGPSAGVGLTLMIAGHTVGWPMPRGGAGSLTRALASLLESFGGVIQTGAPVASLDELDGAGAILLDLTPRQVASIAGDRLPSWYRAKLNRWRYGPGAYKIDWALSDAIPWQAEACRRAGTVHLGGTFEEVAASEAAPWRGRHPERPFVLLAQPSLFDSTRAPEGRHTAWAYCHVPNGSTEDMTTRVERQVERFAPGFMDAILERRVHPPAALEAWNANLVGGDVNGGALTLAQTLARPVWSVTPWSTPVPGLYVCSSSTPPGGGVHGMCGFHAARAVLKRSLR